jgi:hypothetical protein
VPRSVATEPAARGKEHQQMRTFVSKRLTVVMVMVISATSVTGIEPARAAWWQPTAGTSWQIQIDGKPIETSLSVEVYDVDLFDTDQDEIDALHAAGRRVICYFSAGSREKWRDDAGLFPEEAVGKPLDSWPGERWLDIRSTAVRDIMKARLTIAQNKRCDGVDPDNVDAGTYDNARQRTGFPLTQADQLDYNKFLASEAHARGLAVGLKNDVEQIDELLDWFDFAVNEECFSYDECDELIPFIEDDKPVFQIEYGTMRKARRICLAAEERGLSSLVKRRSLGPWRIDCRDL